MNCNKCSKDIPESAAFCGYCGAANTVVIEPSPPSIDSVSEQPAEPVVDDTVSSQEVTPALAENVISYTEVKPVVEQGEFIEEDLSETLPPDVIVTEAVVVTDDKTVKDEEESAHYSHNESSKIDSGEDIAKNSVVAPPVKTSTYFWMILLMLIPGVNIVMLLIWSFSEKININRRNFSRAALIWAGIVIAFAIVGLVIAIFSLLSFGNYLAQPFLFFNY